ncbi:hypothetical protein HDE_08560 [Halotydeus destructor]|nr:hypothetical protein HDE_08560 [Halotydeus destructor]
MTVEASLLPESFVVKDPRNHHLHLLSTAEALVFVVKYLEDPGVVPMVDQNDAGALFEVVRYGKGKKWSKLVDYADSALATLVNHTNVMFMLNSSTRDETSCDAVYNKASLLLKQLIDPDKIALYFSGARSAQLK